MTNVRQFSKQKPRVGRVCIVECEDGSVVGATYDPGWLYGFRHDRLGMRSCIHGKPVRWCYVSDVFPKVKR